MVDILLSIMKRIIGCLTPHNTQEIIKMAPPLETPMCKVENGYYVWKKGDKHFIGQYFNTKEFSCQCKNTDCVNQKISEELIGMLTKIREYLQKPMTITSGFRCEAHQKSLQASGANTVVATKSQHCVGNAADAMFKDLRVNEWIDVARKYSMAVGYASNFIHLDTRKDKKREWKY